MFGRIMYWVGALATVFPFFVMPLPIWLTVILACILFILNFFRSTMKHWLTVIESVCWAIGLYFIFTGPFDTVAIIGLIAFAFWLLITIGSSVIASKEK